MSAKHVALRRAAAESIEWAVAHYRDEGGPALALRFIAALEDAWRHLRDYPGTGSARYAAELEIEGLRFWPLEDFPYLAFYVEREDHVDVIEVLHAQRDIPVALE